MILYCFIYHFIIIMYNRTVSRILGVPGGDAGEFIMAAQVYSDLIEIQVTDKLMKKWFEGYLSFIGSRSFYMHSSVDAVNSLQLELDMEGLDISSPRSEPAKLKPMVMYILVLKQ